MIAHGLPVYVALAPVDMRFGYERLGGLVRERMQTEPRSRALFVFVAKRGHTMKVLTWDGTGVVVIHKKLAAICKHQVGLQGLLRIRAIYAADDSFRKLPPAKRKLARDEHVRPLIDAFFDWAQQTRLTQHGRNLATKALGYASNQEQELRRVLLDGRASRPQPEARQALQQGRRTRRG